MSEASNRSTPEISVVILNYNGARWLHRCLESLKAQTIFDRIEVIIADNLSTDGSDKLSEELLRGWPNGTFLQNGSNLGFCEGNNRPAKLGKGKYLFFLNNDTWLEPDCLEKLLTGIKAAGAQGAMPYTMDYDSENFQTLGASGFDVLGMLSAAKPEADTVELLALGGCCLLIERELFSQLGGFDANFFMYGEEFDLCWRLWATGNRAVGIRHARMHHRMAANINPKGGEKIVESRTSDTKRFYANRNNLLVLLKNASGLLFLPAILQVFYLFFEGIAAAAIFRSWSHFRKAYWNAILDCWHKRKAIGEYRTFLKPMRRKSDIFFLRFLRLRLNRWDDLERALRFGPPKRVG